MTISQQILATLSYIVQCDACFCNRWLQLASIKFGLFPTTKTGVLLVWMHFLIWCLEPAIVCCHLAPVSLRQPTQRPHFASLQMKLWENLTETSFLFIVASENKVQCDIVTSLHFESSFLQLDKKRTRPCSKCQICFLWHVTTRGSSHNCIILLNPGLEHWCWEVLHR